jgi:hypothetical protein
MKQKKNKITHEGTLDLNGLLIPCYILEDTTRILSTRGMQSALKLVDTTGVKDTAKLSGVELSRFISTKWFNSLIDSENKLEHFQPVTCYKGNQKISGYRADVLADFCDLMMEARKIGALKTDRQSLIAEQCEVLIRAFAKVGIIALVDEATGYQYDREKDELQKILKAYISEELLPWQKRFPDEFYREIFRLNGWDFTVNGIQNRPGVIGTWTKQLIYRQLPEGVLHELQENTPKSKIGNYTARFHQSLSMDIGEPHLEKQLVSVITLMRISDNWNDFLFNFNKAYGQQSLFDTRSFEKPTPKGE